MPLTTGLLGSVKSQLGAFLLGDGGITGSVIEIAVGNTLSLTSRAPMWPVVLHQTLIFGQTVSTVNHVFDISLFSTITFVQSGILNVRRKIFQTLTLSQSVTVGKIYSRTVPQTLTLSQSLGYTTSKKTVSNTIAFTQTVSAGFVFQKSITQNLAFSHIANVQRITPAHNTITFTNTATYSKTTGIHNTLGLTQTVVSAGSTFNRLALDAFVPTQVVIANANRSRSFSDTITFIQSVTALRSRFFSVSNTFAPHHTVIPVWVVKPFNTLTLTQSLVQSRVLHLSVSNSLTLTQVMNRSVVYNRGLASVFPIVQGREATVNLQGNPGVKVITIPPVQITKVEQFVSYAVPGHILYLKPPEWGDSEGGLGKIIEHRTITGKIYTHVRRSPSRNLKYKFSVPRAKAEEIRQFVLGNLSEPMYMTNWKGEIWYGYITNNPFKLSPKRRSMPCSIEDYEVDVEFEGVRIH